LPKAGNVFGGIENTLVLAPRVDRDERHLIIDELPQCSVFPARRGAAGIGKRDPSAAPRPATSDKTWDR
jgi:hypothetical protein